MKNEIMMMISMITVDWNDDLNMLPPDTDLLQVDNDLNDNNGDDNDDDLNMLPPVTDLLQVHRHLGRVHRPVQSHRSLISSLYILSISSSVAPSIFTSSLYIFPTLSSP